MTDASCTCAYHPELTNWHLPSCPLAVAPERPALLTDEAAQAAYDAASATTPTEMQRSRMALAAFLSFHATKGREALVERVAEAMYGPFREMDPKLRENADAVVTTLVGEGDV